MISRYRIPHIDDSGFYRTEQSIKRSLFLCSMGHAPDMVAARDFVARIKEEFPDATHNCWAFAAGPPGDTARVGFSDDGEPHGTAGRPMLTVLLHSGVGELVCVVTRYFGGIKLGTGGLVRAYQSAVRFNLETMPTQERIIPVHVQLVMEYTHVQRVRRLFPVYEAQVTAEEFAADASFIVRLPQERVDSFICAVTEETDGGALVEEV